MPKKIPRAPDVPPPAPQPSIELNRELARLEREALEIREGAADYLANVVLNRGGTCDRDLVRFIVCHSEQWLEFTTLPPRGMAPARARELEAAEYYHLVAFAIAELGKGLAAAQRLARRFASPDGGTPGRPSRDKAGLTVLAALAGAIGLSGRAALQSARSLTESDVRRLLDALWFATRCAVPCSIHIGVALKEIPDARRRELAARAAAALEAVRDRETP